MTTPDDNIGNQNPTPAIDAILDYREELDGEELGLENLARKTLNGFMKGFVGEEERFFDPFLEWTLGDKPASQIKILLVTNFWDELQREVEIVNERGEKTKEPQDKDQPYEEAKGCITTTTEYEDNVRKPTEVADQTLLNLFHRLSPWHKAFGKDGNAAAMNQAWGLKRLLKKNLTPEQFRRAIAIWGRVILLLREAGAPLSHVILAHGDFCRFKAQYELSGTNQGVPASAYYLRWFISGKQPPHHSTAITEDMIDQTLAESFHDSYEICKKLAEDSHEVRFGHTRVHGHI
jgi:hypothetical protein